MKLSIFSPYGLLHKEAGLMYLVANYLAKNGAEVTQLRCDGALSACGRDKSGDATRTPFQCARCLNEQRSLVLWGGLRMRDLSAELVPEDIARTSEWIQGVDIGMLPRVEFRGANLWSACHDEFSARWSEVDGDALTAHQREDLRNLYASYVRCAVASERFLAKSAPDLALIASTQDPLAHAYISQARLARIDSAVFWHDVEEDSIVLQSSRSDARYSTSLVFENITAMRPDPRTWAPEVTSVVHEVLTFIGYAPDRLA